MPLPNGQIGVNNNPLVISPFFQYYDESYKPVGSQVMITEVGDIMITENNNTMITE